MNFGKNFSYSYFQFALFLFTFFFQSTGYSQSWSWLKKIGAGGQDNSTYIHGSVTDIEGNTYIVGNYEKKLTLGDKVYDGPNYLKDNYFVAKFDSEGNVKWSSLFNGISSTANISIDKIFIDKTGRVYITGRLSKTVNFGSSVKLSMPPTLGSSSLNPFFVCSYNNDGSPSWAKFQNELLAISEDGKIYTRSKLHNGFATDSQWTDYLMNKINSDSLHCYNSDGQLEFKSEGKWNGNWKLGNGTSKSKSSGQDLLIFQQPNSNLNIFRYKYDNNQYDELIIPNMPIFDVFEVYKDAIYFLGCFPAYGNGKLTFGGISLESSDSNANYHVEGFLVKFDLLTQKFLWGKTIPKMDCGFNKFIAASLTDALYISSEEVGTNSKNYIRAYSINGDLLWTKTSQAYILTNTGIGIDQYGNAYVSGTAFNGLSSLATFDGLSFSYDYNVAFLAKITLPFPTPTRPENLTGVGLSTSSIKLEWTDSKDEIGYQLQYKAQDESVFTDLTKIASNITSFVVDNLLCTKEYTFRILAIGVVNSSPYSIELAVRPLTLPLPKITSPISQACIGKEVKISASGSFAEYIWNTGEMSQNILVTASGEYSVKVKDNSNCVSDFSEKIKITFYANPDTSVAIINNSIVYLGKADSYVWYRNDLPIKGETNNKITPIESGTFKIEASANGCVSTSRSIPFIVTGIESIIETDIDVYPVPASNSITILFRNNLINVEAAINLFNLLGKSLIESKGTNILTLNTSQINPGTYFLQINLNGKCYYRKIIID
jgi:hypothetical protein